MEWRYRCILLVLGTICSGELPVPRDKALQYPLDRRLVELPDSKWTPRNVERNYGGLHARGLQESVEAFLVKILDKLGYVDNCLIQKKYFPSTRWVGGCKLKNVSILQKIESAFPDFAKTVKSEHITTLVVYLF
jgi:hypothetical protein